MGPTAPANDPLPVPRRTPVGTRIEPDTDGRVGRAEQSVGDRIGRSALSILRRIYRYFQAEFLLPFHAFLGSYRNYLPETGAPPTGRMFVIQQGRAASDVSNVQRNVFFEVNSYLFSMNLRARYEISYEALLILLTNESITLARVLFELSE